LSLSVESVASVRGNPATATATGLAAEAARRALAKADWNLSQIDVLVFCGVYRERNICEPAMAPFVQRLLQVEAGVAGDGRIFSFDIANGSNGVANALQVVDGFVAAGRARAALVVAADVDPTPGSSQGLDAGAMGCAFLLGSSDGGRGFTHFHHRSFAEHRHALVGQLEWTAERNGGATHAIRVRRAPDFWKRAVECAALTLAELRIDGVPANEAIGYLVPSPSPPGFASELARALGREKDEILDRGAIDDCALSAAPGLAWEAALQEPSFHESRRVGLLTIGAGLCVSVCVFSDAARSGT
jgi:3-oxoacyl-[acyl-carrier-protein] synthase-3